MELTVACDAVHYCRLASGALSSATVVVVGRGDGRRDVRRVAQLVADAVGVFVAICVGRRDVAARVAALVRERAPLTGAVVPCYSTSINLLTATVNCVASTY